MNYEKQLRRWQARREMAARLRESGHSFAEIGRRLKPPVSAQAVHKMLAKEVKK